MLYVGLITDNERRERKRRQQQPDARQAAG